MAVSKTEVPISKLVDKIETKVQWLYVFEVQLLIGTIKNAVRINRN